MPFDRLRLQEMKKTIKAFLKMFRLFWVVRLVRWVNAWVHGMIYCRLQRNVRYLYSYISFMMKKKRDGVYNVAANPRKTISLLCPTRGRPVGAQHLVESVYRTAAIPKKIEILFYVDSDDIYKDAYQLFAERTKNRFKRLLRCEVFIGEPMSVSKSWNILASKSKGDVFIMANDDQIYVDYGWDIYLDNEIKKFPDEIYCMRFNDGVHGVDWHWIGPIVSRRWYETLGYFTPGIFEFWCNDIWIGDIAKKIGRRHYLSDIVVEHVHYGFKKALKDKTYQRHAVGAGKGSLNRDGELFWDTDRDRERAAEKLRKVMDNDRNKMGF